MNKLLASASGFDDSANGARPAVIDSVGLVTADGRMFVMWNRGVLYAFDLD